MEVLYRMLCLVAGYAFGLFQTSYIYGRMVHIDIREYGSGNAGTTNAMRVLGKKAGIITYIGDMLKGVLAGCLVRFLCASVFDMPSGDGFISKEYILMMYSGLGVVLGHNFPFYMGFRGGKGIAASSGVVIATFFWPIIVIDLLSFVIITFLFRYVSLGSICMMTVHVIGVVVFGALNILKINDAGFPYEFYILTLIFSGMAIYRHRENIKRLLSGTERRIGDKKI